MKTKITALITLFLVSISATAQIDRSKQPKPGPAPKIALEVPGEFVLKNGLKVLVVENHKLPRVSYSLRIDNKPSVEGSKAGVSGILGAMLGNGTTSISKDVFNEEIDFLGANLNFGSNSAFASSLSKYSERILQLMADAAMHPLLTEEEFQKEKEKAIEGLKSTEKSVDAVAGRVKDVLSYGVKHPYGEFTTEETLNAITLDDVKSFYRKNFNPNNAYLVVVGDVNFKSIEKQIKKYFKKWSAGPDISRSVPPTRNNVPYTQINFIDMPNAVQSNISVNSNVKLKMNDPDYHAVLIANKILGGGFNSYLNMNLREEHGYTYGARSNVGTSRYGASRFSASSAVRNAVTDSAIVESIKEINRIKNEDVNSDALRNAKAKYVGDFVLALEKPQTIARYALNIKLNKLPKDFYKTYLQKINAVTIADVKRVANKYFTVDNARVVVVGKGSDVVSNLEKTGIPIEYFDKYGSPTKKPVFSKPIPDGVTAQTVMDSYIKAIGGKTNCQNIKSTFSSANVTVQGAPFPITAELKVMTPNKESMEMSAQGMGVIMKQKWNGESGYAEQGGQKKPMSDKEVADKKAGGRALFPELSYGASDLTLETIVAIEGADHYKIKVTKGDKDSFRYYDVNTGLLTRAESTTEAQGQSITSVINYGKYTAVNSVKFPHTMNIKAGPQVISMTMTSIKVNEGVTEADFN